MAIPGLSKTDGGSKGPEAAGPGVMIPFIRATARHFEPAFDVTATVGAATQALGPFDVPSHGFMRDLVLLVEATGGALGGGTIDPDFPWSLIDSVELTDTNGYSIVFPTSGYNLYLANLFGGYRGFNDPTQHPDYASGVSDLNPTFMLRIPVEITPWDGFGALSNQNQSSPFRVRLNLAGSAAIVSGGTPTLPSVRIRGYLEAYSPVAPTDMQGRPQEQAPPGHGATQYWSTTTKNVAAGTNTIYHTRVGNLIRNLIYVARDSSGDRSATVEPDEITLSWDSRQVVVGVPNAVHRAAMEEAFGLTTIPTGVLAFQFTDDQDGAAGYESRHLWLPTVSSTRLELSASFGAAGTLEIVTNDIAVTALGR